MVCVCVRACVCMFPHGAVYVPAMVQLHSQVISTSSNTWKVPQLHKYGSPHPEAPGAFGAWPGVCTPTQQRAPSKRFQNGSCLSALSFSPAAVDAMPGEWLLAGHQGELRRPPTGAPSLPREGPRAPGSGDTAR